MWHSDISSERLPRLAPWLLLAAAVVLAVAVPGVGRAKVFLTVEDALALAFPDCEIERRTVFLSDEQLQRARELVGEEIEGALAHPYEATCAGEYAGTAYFDTHRVRTLPETLMVVIDPEEQVRRIEILAFREPEEYIPREIWYEQFSDRELSPELDLKRDIRGVTGATLTARATTEAVRRVLALHKVIRAAATLSEEQPAGEKSPEEKPSEETP